MEAYGDPRVDMLKIDIEGAELVVLDSLLADGPTPSTICVEFDQPQPIRGVIRTSRKLRDAGYALVKIDRWNYTFVR